MLNDQSIKILHFSDFHLNKDHEKESQTLLQYMLKAIKNNHKQIDLVVFSGDMIDKGGDSYGNIYEAFKKFKELVIDEVCKQLCIGEERFVFSPGNHDIDGSRIDPMADIGINQEYMVGEGKVQEFITNKSLFEEKYSGRIQAVKNFEREYYENLSNVTYTYNLLSSNFVFCIKGTKIGVSSLNTVWRCNNSKKANPIILGTDQITNSHKLIEECDVKFAVTHFECEYESVPEWEKKMANSMIAENYDVLFTGHTHSVGAHTIDDSKGHRCLHLMSAGTLDGNRYEDNVNYKNGFQIITYYPDNYFEVVAYYQRNGQFFCQDYNNMGNTDTLGVYRWSIEEKNKKAQGRGDTKEIKQPASQKGEPKTQDAEDDETKMVLLSPKLVKKLTEIKKNHPSIKLMEENGHILDESLYPKVKGKENKSLPDIIKDHHQSAFKSHLIIEGEGGMGKSVALLSIFMSDELIKNTIYIKLNALDYKKASPISDHINKMFANDNSVLDSIKKKADVGWSNKPSLTLLLDGLNEIPQLYYDIVKEEIQEWSKYKGIQLIIASRPDARNHELQFDGSHDTLSLEALDKETVKNYLISINATVPDEDDDVWKIICNPLMLNLYYKGQSSDEQYIKKGSSEGIVIWNYLQYEINKPISSNEANKGTKDNNIAALLYAAPFVAYQMAIGQSDTVSGSNLARWAKLSITQIYGKQYNPPTLPDWDSEIKGLLTKTFRLFHSTKNGNYELMHRQLRDALAAIHLLNIIDLNANTMPDDWKKPLGVFVINHVADLISDEQAERIWELNRKHPSDSVATTNVMDVQWRRLKGDFSNLDFSGLDLREVLLLSYCTPHSQKLKLPQKADLMKDVRLSKGSFQMKTNDNIGSGRIAALAVTPDGQHLISGSWDNVLQVWDVNSCRCQQVLRGHNRQVTAVAVNDKWCVSGSMDETVKVWNCTEIDNWSCTDTKEGPTLEESNKYRHNYNCVNTLYLTKSNICFSGWADGMVRVWRIDERGRLKMIKEKLIPNDVETNGDYIRVISLAVTSNEKYCVIRAGNNRLYIWEWENDDKNSNVEIIKSPSGLVCGLAVHGNTCVFSEPGSVWKMDVATEEKSKTLLGYHDSLIESVAFSLDGKLVVTGSWDETVRVWNLETGLAKFGSMKKHTRRIHAVAVSGDGKFIYSGSRDRTIRVWDMENGKHIKTILAESHNWITAIKAAGKNRCVIGCEDGSIRLWDTAEGKCLKVFTTDGILSALATAILGEGKLLCLSGDKEGLVSCWDLDASNGERKDFIKTRSQASITSISIEYPYVAIGMQNGKIEIWDIHNIKEPCFKWILEHGQDWVNAVCLRNCKCYSGGSDGYVKIWNIGDEKPIEEIKVPHSERGKLHRISSLDVSPKGDYIVYGEDAETDETDDSLQNNNVEIKKGGQIIVLKYNGNKYERCRGIFGAKRGRRPVVVLDDEFCVVQDSFLRQDERGLNPFLKKHNLSAGRDAQGWGSPGNTIGWVSAFASDGDICYFGTRKGYVGFAKTDKFELGIRGNDNKISYPYDDKIEMSITFKQWPVLMDVDVVGLDFSRADIDDDLRGLLYCNGAKTS